MPNLPLDANDEDILQRGLRRPSLDDTLLPINNAFTAVRSQYDNFAPGVLSTDNIWPLRNAAELANLLPAQRREFLEQRGLAPPADAIPSNVNVPGLDQIVQELGSTDSSLATQQLAEAGLFTERLDDIQSRLDAALAAGGNIPTDSYGQTLQGPTTQPLPVTAPPPGGSYSPPGTQPQSSSNSVYNYTPIDLYDDRYDFLTGQIVRKGIATGAKGGVGSEGGFGNTLPSQGPSTDQQSEIQPIPPNVGPNDTAQYDDAILRQARLQELDAFGGTGENVNDDLTRSNTSDSDTEARLGIDPRGQDQRNVPPRTENSTPRAEQAPRTEIIASRRRATQDIRSARANGQNLVRLRRPDGTYYAGPPQNANNRQLPQRARDLGF